MKAEIKANGMLCITAENEIESFCLDVWMKVYTESGEQSTNLCVGLQVDTFTVDGSLSAHSEGKHENT